MAKVELPSPQTLLTHLAHECQISQENDSEHTHDFVVISNVLVMKY